MDPSSLIAIGRVTKRHGVRGELRVLPHNPDSAAMEVASSLRLRGPHGESESRRVLATRRNNRFYLMRLEGVTTAEAADQLIGYDVCIAREALPALASNEYYHTDLIGCAVRTEAGVALGKVWEIISTGSNDVCVVRGGGREYLIPMIDDVIASLDVASGEIVVRPLPGLLDL